MLVPPVGIASAQEVEPSVERTAGPDRIATAVATSSEHRESAASAVLATAGNYPDALAAGALASGLDAPVLLSGSDALPDLVRDELTRLGVETVYVLGGRAALSDQVAEQAAATGAEVVRLAGTDRFDTARQVALAAGPAEAREVVLALGLHAEPMKAWPDALAAGTLAATPQHVPTLLSLGDTLPAATAEALAALETRRVLISGGTAGISQGVEDHLRALGYETERIAGSDRYETSARLAELAYVRFGSDQQAPTFASGATFPDALAAGALAAESKGPLLLVAPDRLPDSTDAYLRARVGHWQQGAVVGGAGVVSDFVVEELGAALTGAPRPEPPPEPEPEPTVVSTFAGTASWYGPGFQGRRTACGGRFDRNALTAAHRSLPCGTRVRITNTANDAQVTVTITDRGPYHGNRVTDLSERAAMVAGFHGAGTAHVIGEVLAE